MKLGDYEVIRPIATGGMGAVFEVEHRGTHARYAAKVVKNAGDARARERFRREAELLARVDRHPGIVKIHSFGETPEGGLYMILDLVRGESLEKKLEREGKLPPHRAAALARSIALALGAAHALGVVHRDVKPANILVDAVTGEPRLADFGIAAARDLERLTKTGAFVGTVAYVAPEQARGRAGTPASDVFSLGAVLFEMLAGHGPILGTTPVQLLAQLATSEPLADVRTFSPDVPAALAAIVGRALEKDAAHRPADGAALARELEAFLDGKAVAARANRGRARRLRLVAALLVLPAAAAAVAVVLARGGVARSERDRTPVAALEAVARASAGTCDAEALLAARAAVALAAETSEAVSWETEAAGARAAYALGAARPALELAGRALEHAPPERREALALLHARARLGAEGAGAALEELASLRSPEAARLRAHLLLVARRWSDLAGLAGDDSFVAGARALGRCRLDGDTRRARLAIDRREKELLCALDVIEARAAIAVIDSATHGSESNVLDYVSEKPERLHAPCERAIELLEDASRAPRYVSKEDALATVDRALFYVQRIGNALGAIESGEVPLVDALARTAFLFAREDDEATISVQSRVEELVGTREDHLDPKRRAFLETSFDKTTGPVEARFGAIMSKIYEIRHLERARSPLESLDRVERLILRLPAVDITDASVAARGDAERLAGELALRSTTVVPEVDRERYLLRALAHQGEAKRHVVGTSGNRGLEHEIDQLGVELDIARGDLDAARRDLTSTESTGNRFLAGEIKRLRGNAADAEPLLRQAAASALKYRDQLSGLHFLGDALVSLRLVEVALGKRDSFEALERAYDARGDYPTLLPWIDRDAKKALGR